MNAGPRTSRALKERYSAPSAGFTLIELLVALLLLGLVFLLLTSGLQFGTSVWSARDNEVSGNSEVLTAQSVLRRVLSETRPVMIEADVSHARHVYFAGTESSLRFVTSMPGHLGIGGFYEVVIYPVESDAGNRVEMSWHLFRTAEAALAASNEDRHAVLLTGVNQLQFAYFGYRGKNEPAQWYSDWQDFDHLPDLIRMHVVFNDAAISWPDLVVAPVVRSLNLIIDPERINN
jgi:general secretion pathway protein J